jgi:tetratricopeptide (TPR) repeat protein
MSVAKVLRLDDYRDRRLHRIRVARALWGGDPNREVLFGHFVEVAGLTGADRVAVLWVDEYGPGLVHPHAVLDLLADTPRRRFSTEPLHKAWEDGVPGTYDQATDVESSSSSTCAVALGSDGSRAWFLVAESVSPRAAFDASVRERIMFLAGECSAVVLHRDLESTDDREEGDRFAGWHILQDLEGREDDPAASEAIGRRFAAGRLARMLIDEELAISTERRAAQAERAREELVRADDAETSDGEHVRAAIAAFENDDERAFADALMALGQAAEVIDHHHGALELYRCAYEIGAAIGVPSLAIAAARMSGRVLRRRAVWRDAEHWYGVAHSIAATGGVLDLAARALAGLAVIKKEIGNLPAAREGFQEALAVAEKSGDRDTEASVHHDLLGLEHATGNFEAGLRHGWRAVSMYTTDVLKMRCMVSLGGALKDFGDHTAAEDAYLVVAHRSDEPYYLTYAWDALAHLAALRGDVRSFDERAAKCDELNWESGSLSAKAEILYYRGIGHRALGRIDLARDWLERATLFAEEHGFNRALFRAEAALSSLGAEAERRSSGVEEPAGAPAAPPDVRDGLRAMREELTSVGS